MLAEGGGCDAGGGEAVYGLARTGAGGVGENGYWVGAFAIYPLTIRSSTAKLVNG
jgi:hypothetical protein